METMPNKEDWYEFCGFNESASTFSTKFIYNERNLTLTPCAEFGIIFSEHSFLLFATVLHFFQLKSSERIPPTSSYDFGVSPRLVRSILAYKLFVILLTCILLFLSIILGIFSTYELKLPLLIEYGLAIVIWFVYSFIWIISLKNDLWTRPTCLSIIYCISSKCFLMIAAQRWLLYGPGDPRTVIILVIVGFHLGNYLVNIVEWKISKRRNSNWQRLQEDESMGLNPDADEGANILSRLFFCWVNPLIKKGYNGQLKQVHDLFNLPPSLRVLHTERRFIESAPNRFTDDEDFSLMRALLRAFGLQYFMLGLLRLLGDAFTFAGPILLHLLVTCLQDGDPDGYGYLYASLMLVSTFLSAFTDFNFNFYVNKVSLRIRSATISALYDKLLQIPLGRLSKFSSGQVINFMSTDVDRIVNVCGSFHAFWSLPIKTIVALYLLYREIGLAFLSGLLAAILMVPINKYITVKIGSMSAKMMKYKDQRMRLITETMRAIRAVKLSNWETYFEQRIDSIRKKELKYLKARKYLDAICVYLWASAPVLITISILLTYTLLLHEKLTAAKIFTSLALVNILILPLNAFPWVLNGLIEAYVSKKRLDKFFALENFDFEKIYSLIEGPKKLLEIENMKFSWSNAKTSVKNFNLSGEEGMIIGIMGPVGSGKSTILMGILGETEYLEPNGTLKIRQNGITEGFAYVGHECWLRRGTIRDNILCESHFREDFYQKVLEATTLDHDIELMPSKDLYHIADEGTTLSGGQRARLALARAIYQDNDVYLLDDPFASLDSKVGKFIWQNCLENLLKKRGKLVLVATHHTEYLRNADFIISLDSVGQISKSGTPEEVLSAEDLAKAELSATSDTTNVPFDMPEIVPPADEEKESGTVKIGVYWSYLHATGYCLSALILAFLVAMQLSKNLSDAWLSRWTLNSNDSNTWNENGTYTDYRYPLGARELLPLQENESKTTEYFLIVYVSLAIANTIFTLFRAFLFAYGGIVSARNLHTKLLHRVLNSSVAWWDATPWGRVVNRLCSDVYMVDDSLPFQLNICLASFVNLIGALILTSFALPYLIPVILILFVLYYAVQRYYRFTTCEVKRITSLTLSPLYSHITDTVTGLVTIRAHRFVERFTEVLRDRLGQNLAAQYSSLAASQWLSVRLQMLGVLMVSAVCYGAVVEVRFHYVESGLVGLAITYALSMTNLLNSLLCSFIDTEKELVSVERIVDYVENVPLEETNAEEEGVDRFLFCRTINGQIDFTCVSLRYSPGLPWALKNVTFHIEAGQRVGIIGRTGSGKSSIFQALLRAHPIETGKIFIDGTVDVGQIDPKAVRSIFGLVTQSPFIFSGTVRENICVDKEYPDHAIIAILHKAGLEEWLRRSGGLDSEIAESGANLSFGEKQILSLCRLILSEPKIVLIDEATAHLDEPTHILMNNLLRQTLPTTTVLSIVHRLSGIDTFDWMIEMSNGTVHRQGDGSSAGYIPWRRIWYKQRR